jgi:16S rRNA (guanine(1405)-N(7))-methyltransferase
VSREISQVVEAVRVSSKYRHICPETIACTAARALRQSRSVKEAIKRTKRKLHQICASFIASGRLARARRLLLDGPAGAHAKSPREMALELLQLHASTRERIDILETLYPAIFSVTGTPRRVFDLGCGLHPCALPWMGLPHSTEYLAYDIDGQLIDLLNLFFSRCGLPATARCRDIVVNPADEVADVAFLLKLVPTLEQQQRGSALRVLQAVRAAFSVVSFPTASLGGRNKGMRSHYREIMDRLLHEGGWTAERLDFPREMFFVVRNARGTVLPA